MRILENNIHLVLVINGSVETHRTRPPRARFLVFVMATRAFLGDFSTIAKL